MDNLCFEYRWRHVHGREGGRIISTKTTITGVDIHHRRDCLPLVRRQRRIDPKPTRSPEPEGNLMLIHLLTCLALTAFTLSVFAWYVLSEEQTS
ncbi:MULTISPECIES: hypothetical protein [Pseudomonas]|uniref:hypothetical protein n=1 Tax=Pseudomonas TaxID=286 RepID=UPI0038F5E578